MGSSRKIYEKEIEKHLFNNLSELSSEYKKYSDSSRQKQVESGVIDILARDLDHNPVVIEIKLGEAKHDAFGQIMAYMGDIENELLAESVSGIIVAESFSKKLKHAIMYDKFFIHLHQYELNFNFDRYYVE